MKRTVTLYGCYKQIDPPKCYNLYEMSRIVFEHSPVAGSALKVQFSRSFLILACIQQYVNLY